MTNQGNESLKTLLAELYQLDPELRQFEADLPNLIAALKTNQPQSPLTDTFVHNLRASLLQHAHTTPITKKAALIPSPFFWWAARLAPIGVMAVLFVMLVPDITNAPDAPGTQVALEDTSTTNEAPATESGDSMVMLYDAPEGRSLPTDSTEESMDIMMTTPDDSMTMKAPASALVVLPPQVGDTATITNVTLGEAGWVVIYADDGGAFGEILGTTYLPEGTHVDVTLPLARTLVYPEMITVVVYTAQNTTQFVAENELMQIDPVTGSVLTVTVPVVSALELGLPQ